MPSGFGRVLLVSFMGGVVFAGCLSSNEPNASPPPAPPLVRDPADVWPLLSAALDAVDVVKENVKVPSFDGKNLDNWVYRPAVSEKVPVIVNFSPYWSNLAPDAESEGDHFSQYLIDYFLPRGYAVVLSSVRGTGHSEGCFDLGGAIERQDAVEVIEYFAAQSWSNGNVAAGGKSYDGTTPQGAATEHPAALKAIVPVSPISELYKYNYKGGLPYGGLHGATFNARYVVQVGWDQFLPDASLDPEETTVDDACADFAIISANGVASAATGDYGPYWQERDYAAGADRATAALFYIHGLQDWNVKPDNVLPWLDRYAGPKKVWLHQWSEEASGGHVYPFRDDWNYTMLRFFDHTLKGIDTGLFEEPMVQVEDTRGVWRHEDAWPPTSVVPERFFLTSSGGAGSLAPTPGDATTRAFVDDGLVPTWGASSENVLAYVSEPLVADLHFAGMPVLHASVASNLALGKVAVNLYDVPPQGDAVMMDWGGLNLRHRQDVRDPQPVVPRTAYSVAVELFPQDTVVPAGHRIGLTLAGNAGSSSYDSFEALPYQSTITVTEGADSFLEVPVEPKDALVLESPQPSEADYCWAC